MSNETIIVEFHIAVYRKGTVLVQDNSEVICDDGLIHEKKDELDELQNGICAAGFDLQKDIIRASDEDIKRECAVLAEHQEAYVLTKDLILFTPGSYIGSSQAYGHFYACGLEAECEAVGQKAVYGDYIEDLHRLLKEKIDEALITADITHMVIPTVWTFYRHYDYAEEDTFWELVGLLDMKKLPILPNNTL